MHSDPRNVLFENQASLVLEARAHVAQFTTKTHYSDTPLEILIGAIQNKGLDALQKYFDTSWSLCLSNTGGQIEFQEILPLLVSGPCVFFYTFRLDHDLNEHYIIEYELSDGIQNQNHTSQPSLLLRVFNNHSLVLLLWVFLFIKGMKGKGFNYDQRFFWLAHTKTDCLMS